MCRQQQNNNYQERNPQISMRETEFNSGHDVQPIDPNVYITEQYKLNKQKENDIPLDVNHNNERITIGCSTC